jgi:hypothetical protein
MLALVCGVQDFGAVLDGGLHLLLDLEQPVNAVR